jgi:hypothetical protein
LFQLQCNTDETEEKGKLKVDITANYRYFLLHMLPFVFTVYGIWKSTKNLQQGMFLVFAGISFMILVFAITSTLMYKFKRSFKDTFNLL